MKIVIMADNRKNELLVNFCIAYRQLLSKHTLISLHNTATLLESAAELNVVGLSTDYSGGFDQLAQVHRCRFPLQVGVRRDDNFLY